MAMHRRTFVLGTLATAGAVALGRQSWAASDTVRVAVAGLNGRGGDHIDEFSKIPGVKIVALIDPDTRTFDKRIKQVEARNKATPRTYQDIRKALEARDIDAISIATPNHWHALMTIWACQAGKDVYVEKPCSHNIHEGRIAVETARKTRQIVQHGTQNRSLDSWANLAELVKSHRFGKLLVSRGLCYKTRNSIGIKPVSAPPPEVDFDLWTGPAQRHDFHTNLVHYNWHWFWDFGNGDIGNQGVHQMDIARWMIPNATLPRSVQCLGGRYGYSDQGETPNSQIAVMDFGPTQLIFEVRGLKTDAYHGERSGNVLHFEEGLVAGNKFYPRGKKEGEPLPKLELSRHRGLGGGIFGNFIAAVRNRQVASQDADILEGHYSSALCHLANISFRLGSDTTFAADSRIFADNSAATETLGRLEQHLQGDNGLKLDTLKLHVGPKLAVDAEREAFLNHPDANKLLTRNYRPGFAVPDRV